MTRSLRLAAIVAFLGVTLVTPATAMAIGSPRLAAVQVALRAKHLYNGDIDGIAGPSTKAALTALQKRQGGTLEELAGPGFGSRPLVFGTVGGDVAQLQFLLAWHGFPNGTIDGAFGLHVQAALVRFQRW